MYQKPQDPMPHGNGANKQEDTPARNINPHGTGPHRAEETKGPDELSLTSLTLSDSPGKLSSPSTGCIQSPRSGSPAFQTSERATSEVSCIQCLNLILSTLSRNVFIIDRS